MASATPLIIPEKSQQGIIEFHKQCYSTLNSQGNLREQMRQIDLAYMREQDQTVAHRRAQLANRLGDTTKFQNVTVPVVMPQVEAAVQYQAAVFLSGSPLFGWVAAPDSEDAALQYQAIIEENATRGGWVQQLLLFLRDGFKYNRGIIEVNWGRIVTQAIETDLNFTGGQEGKPKEVIWTGNQLRRWDPYNTFFDSRYKPTEIYKNGEFCGMTELMSRVHLKKFINELPDKMATNIKAAFESGTNAIGTDSGGIESYFIPQINPSASIQSNYMDWLAWANISDIQQSIAYKNAYEVTTLYGRIIPSDFGLNVPSRNTPQIWKFIIINHQVLIYAERQTNAHGFLPTLFCQPNEDGLGYQTKSLAENAKPFQEIASALVNSAMASRRRAISDRGIYNPLLISEHHINNDSPTAKIPLRPSAYGKTPQEAYYPIPYRDDQSSMAIQELPIITGMADKINGQNAVRQGQFQRGNKNNPEFQAVMAAATGQDQIRALLLEAQVFTPLKEIIKINTIQYQAGITIFSPSQARAVKIDPIVLRQAFATYKLTDGLSPTDKTIHSDEFIVALQTMSSSPALGSSYNIAPAFSYLMKTRHVDLKPFEKSKQQIAYEQALGAWQQLAQLALQKGTDFKQPQPIPANYGYELTPAQGQPGQQTQGQSQQGQ